MSHNYVDLASGESEYIKFLLSKAQKMATALYLVTGSIGEKEPLKRDIRKSALSLVESVSYLTKETVYTIKDNIVSQVKHLDSLIFIGQSAGYISEMNSAILRREIDKMKDVLSESGVESKGHVLPQDFFETDKQFTIKDKNERSPVPDTYGLSQGAQKKDPVVEMNNRIQESVKDKNLSSSSPVKPRKKNRREFILNIIKKKKDVNIKDISEAFDGCSEKTIQRELIDLVNEGSVVKEGERRWSRYRLA